MSQKESLRKKIEKAKEKVQEAFGKEGVSPGLRVAVESLLMVFDIVIALFLVKKDPKNSSNSGLPSSRNSSPNDNCNKN